MSKKKLLIVGDSYGCKLSSDEKKFQGWFVNKLLMDTYDVTNLCEPGNSQLAIHRDFVSNQNNFDKVVYIVTSSNRHTWTDHKNNVHREAGHVQHLKDSIKKEFDPINKLKKNILLGYYTHFLDHDLFDYASSAIITEALELRPDILLLHCFWSKLTKKLTGSNFYISKISNQELVSMGINSDYLPIDTRPAHLTQENNDILAKFIYEKLNGSKRNLKIEDFIIPLYIDRKKYFENFNY